MLLREPNQFRRRHPTLAAAIAALDGEGVISPEVDRLKEFLTAMADGRNGRAREGRH